MDLTKTIKRIANGNATNKMIRFCTVFRLTAYKPNKLRAL